MSIYFIGYDHLEQLRKAAETITVDPLRHTLYYLCPRISAFFNNFYELYLDPSLEAFMPPAATAPILREIANLTHCAGLQRRIVPYTTLCFTISSSGGYFSLTPPALFIPDHYLFRKNGHSSFTQERADEDLSAQRWLFSDDETRFLIARELGRMREGDSLLRVAVRVAIFAALFAFYLVPSAWLLVCGVGLYLISERTLAERADLHAIAILAQRGVARPNQVAIATLEKMRQQNLDRRENNLLARLFILESGNNLLDCLNPFLTTRIERINHCVGNF